MVMTGGAQAMNAGAARTELSGRNLLLPRFIAPTLAMTIEGLAHRCRHARGGADQPALPPVLRAPSQPPRCDLIHLRTRADAPAVWTRWVDGAAWREACEAPGEAVVCLLAGHDRHQAHGAPEHFISWAAVSTRGSSRVRRATMTSGPAATR